MPNSSLSPPACPPSSHHTAREARACACAGQVFESRHGMISPPLPAMTAKPQITGASQAIGRIVNLVHGVLPDAIPGHYGRPSRRASRAFIGRVPLRQRAKALQLARLPRRRVDARVPRPGWPARAGRRPVPRGRPGTARGYGAPARLPRAGPVRGGRQSVRGLSRSGRFRAPPPGCWRRAARAPAARSGAVVAVWRPGARRGQSPAGRPVAPCSGKSAVRPGASAASAGAGSPFPPRPRPSCDRVSMLPPVTVIRPAFDTKIVCSRDSDAVEASPVALTSGRRPAQTLVTSARVGSRAG